GQGGRRQRGVQPGGGAGRELPGDGGRGKWGADGDAAGGAGRGRVGHGHGDRALGAGGGSEPGQRAAERRQRGGELRGDGWQRVLRVRDGPEQDRMSTRLNPSHGAIPYGDVG